VAAAAKTNYAPEQGLVSMTGTFFDTIIVCTLTGLSLVVTGVWTGPLKGVAITNSAFLSAYPDWGTYILMVSLSLFAFSSIIGWSYYSERCAVYLFGTKSIFYFRLAWVSAVGVAAFLHLEEIWCLADIVNGLMAFPNLVGVLSLSPIVIKETKEYFEHLYKKNLM
ncbi:MAG: alanine:cation symporter family protein, partial [Acidaminococcaceae bacterium]|nr:alanine:cation symporter family protein [Acidaminococcaceae bacterium]